MAIDKVLNKTLDDEFEVDGLWWLPYASDMKIPGTLIFKSDEIKLELMGGFKDIFNESRPSTNIIFGQSGFGEEFTLIKAASPRDVVHSFTGYKSEMYPIDSFLVGGFFENTEDISFYSCTLYPTYLTFWLNNSPISYEVLHSKIDSTLERVSVIFNQKPTFKYSLESLDAEIEEKYTLNSSIDSRRENVHLNFKSGLSIVAENQSLEWFEHKNFELKNLLSILIGKGVHFKNIYFKGEYEEPHPIVKNLKSKRKNYAYFITQRDYENKEKFSNRDILLDFFEIENEFPSLLNNWFEKSDDLKDIYNLYFGILYSEVVYLESSLLKTIQILEIYHRNKYEGKVFEKERFKLEKKKIQGLSERCLDGEVHRKMMDSIGQANNYSLKMRLADLFAKFSDESTLTLIGNSNDVKTFIKQLVDTRNYLAHYDDKRKPNLLTTVDEQFYGIQRLKAIVTMMLFIDLGLDEDFVINKIKSSSHFSYSLAKAKEFLNNETLNR